MPGVSREQIERAKQVDILDYVLKHEPNNVRRIGSAHYLNLDYSRHPILVVTTIMLTYAPALS